MTVIVYTLHPHPHSTHYCFKNHALIDDNLTGGRPCVLAVLLRLPCGELLDVHGVDDVVATVERRPAEQHVHPLRRVEGVPEDVGVAVQARPQERQAGDHPPVPPDAAAPAVDHAEPCTHAQTTYSKRTSSDNLTVADARLRSIVLLYVP